MNESHDKMKLLHEILLLLQWIKIIIFFFLYKTDSYISRGEDLLMIITNFSEINCWKTNHTIVFAEIFGIHHPFSEWSSFIYILG